MPLFGGDPRYAPIQIILETNIWYDILCLPILFIFQLKRYNNQDSNIISFVYFFCEIFRILLVWSHRKANIPVFVAFFIVTFIPVLVLDFVWYFEFPNRTPLDKSLMVGNIVLHILEIGCGIVSYRGFSRYQNGFYQFSRRRLANTREETVPLLNVQ